MSTFNTSTGSVMRVSSAGSDTWQPPFTSGDQIDNYIKTLQAVVSDGGPIKGVIVTDFRGATLQGPVNATSVSTSPKLPAVQVWVLQNGGFVVVYVDANGNSSFSYKNDPNNYVQLVANGSQIGNNTSSPSPSSMSSPAPPTTAQSSGTPWWVWLMVACVILMFLGGVSFMILKKK